MPIHVVTDCDFDALHITANHNIGGNCESGATRSDFAPASIQYLRFFFLRVLIIFKSLMLPLFLE